MSTKTTGIDRINLVIVPTTDQDRSIEFYTGTLGFEKRTDIAFGEKYRWVEVYPPNGPTGIALAPPQEGTEVTPGHTGISLSCADIDAVHADLTAAGADVDDVMRMGDPVPPMFFFRDPEGHTLLIVETE